MRAVGVNFTGAANGVALDIPADCLLVGIATSNLAFVVSSDPLMTAALWKTPTASGQDRNIIAGMQVGASNVAVTGFQLTPAFPLSAGERIYLSCAGQNACILYFADVA